MTQARTILNARTADRVPEAKSSASVEDYRAFLAAKAALAAAIKNRWKGGDHERAGG